MDKTFYGKRMFVADLLLVSIWSFFLWYVTGSTLPVLILVTLRLAASFQIHARSMWAFFTSVLFAIAYAGCIFCGGGLGLILEPVDKMIYVAGCLSGKWADMRALFDDSVPHALSGLIWGALGLWSAWLLIVPVWASARFRSVMPAVRRDKPVLAYLAACLAVGLVVWLHDSMYGIFTFTGLAACTPLVYDFANRKIKGGLFARILKDRPLILYLGIAGVFYLAFVFGILHINPALFSFLLPVMLYRLAMLAAGNAPVRTLPALLLGCSGMVLCGLCGQSWDETVIRLCVGVLCGVAGCVLMSVSSRSVWAGILLFMGSTVVIPAFMIGYNPLAVAEGEYVRPFGMYGHGLYEFRMKDYTPDRPMSGLRDRYGVVVEPRYYSFDYLGRHRRYVMARTKEAWIDENSEIAIFDLTNRREIISAERDGICSLREVSPNVFALCDREGMQIYTLYLPGIVNGNYNSRVRLVPTPPDEAWTMSQEP